MIASEVLEPGQRPLGRRVRGLRVDITETDPPPRLPRTGRADARFATYLGLAAFALIGALVALASIPPEVVAMPAEASEIDAPVARRPPSQLTPMFICGNGLPDVELTAALARMRQDAAVAWPQLRGDQVGETWGAVGISLSGTGTGPGYCGRGCGVGHRASRRTQVGLGEAEASGGLDRAIIRRLVRRRLGAIRGCYAQQLELQPELSGTVTVELHIDASGRVRDASTDASTDGGGALGRCATAAIESIRFPSPEGGSVEARIPIRFATAVGP